MRMQALIEAAVLAEGVPANWGNVTSGMQVAWKGTPEHANLDNAKKALAAKAAAIGAAATKVANLATAVGAPATDERVAAAVGALNKAVEGLLFQVGFVHGTAHPEREG